MIEKVLPDAVASCEAFDDPSDAVFFPDEAVVISRAVDRRRRELQTARHCARRALRQLGLPPAAVLPGEHREPLWPPGVVGSLTHCTGYRPPRSPTNAMCSLRPHRRHLLRLAAGEWTGSRWRSAHRVQDLVDQTLTVRTDDDEDIDYQFSELDELTHAYAVSIHRSEGSEYPCVVILIITSAWMMLQRNLLYTAVTRAKKFVVLVGSKKPSATAFALSAPDAVTPP